MPIDYKGREMNSTVMLKIETCGKSLSLFHEVLYVETRFFFQVSVTQRGFPLNRIRYSQSLGDHLFHTPPYVRHMFATTTIPQQRITITT